MIATPAIRITRSAEPMIRSLRHFGVGLLTVTCLLTAATAEAAEQKSPFRFRVSAAGGYDNNSGLNPQRKGDGFAQETVGVTYRRLLNKKTEWRLSYDVANVNYFEATDQDILAHNVTTGLNFLLTPQTILENQYTFGYLDFPYNSSVNSYSNEVRVGLKQKIGRRWLLKTGLAALQRDYTEKRARYVGLTLDEDYRSDDRISVDASAVFQWRKDLSFNAGFTYLQNDSNDLFHDHYDYKAPKFQIGTTWKIDPKWTASLRHTYERRTYDERPISGSPETVQKDHQYTTNLAVFYKLSKDLTLGSNVTYKQKNSNEPTQKYSNTTGTLGLYYSF